MRSVWRCQPTRGLAVVLTVVVATTLAPASLATMPSWSSKLPLAFNKTTTVDHNNSLPFIIPPAQLASVSSKIASVAASSGAPLSAGADALLTHKGYANATAAWHRLASGNASIAVSAGPALAGVIQCYVGPEGNVVGVKHGEDGDLVCGESNRVVRVDIGTNYISNIKVVLGQQSQVAGLEFIVTSGVTGTSTSTWCGSKDGPAALIGTADTAVGAFASLCRLADTTVARRRRSLAQADVDITDAEHSVAGMDGASFTAILTPAPRGPNTSPEYDTSSTEFVGVDGQKVKLTIVTNASPSSDFRIVPLSYYTPDGRNNGLFSPTTYGVRVAWMGSTPPASLFTVNGVSYAWAKTGTFDPQKAGWTSTFQYSFTDVAAPSGNAVIKVGPYTYNVIIPNVGGAGPADDEILFIGDPDTNNQPPWAITGVTPVLQSALGKAQNARLVAFLGDNFYHNDPYIRTTAWPALSAAPKPITNFLVLGTNGNHDYDVNGCGGLVWNQNIGALSCTTYVGQAKPSSAWVQLFFATDGMTSFETLSAVYRAGCRVPSQYSTQVVVVGRTAIINIDNVWQPAEVSLSQAGQWPQVAARVAPVVDRVVVAGHWDSPAMGATSNVQQWVNYLTPFFTGKQITGVQGHTHVNTQNGPGLFTVGGNGFASCGCTTCTNCDCCCPSLYKGGTFTLGGWSAGKFCNAATPPA